MLDYYPHTVIPKEVEEINNNGIPVPELPKLLDFPKRPRKKIIGLIILILSILLFITVNLYKVPFLGSLGTSVIVFLLFFIAVISLTATIFEMVQNGNLKKKYLISVKLYKEQEEELKVIKEQREQIIKNNKNPEAIIQYRKDTIRKYFNFCYDKIQANRVEYISSKERFKVFLEQHFLNKTMDNILVVHETKNIEYTPDFILKLSRPKINIAIEIEEPYTLKEIEGQSNISSDEKYAKIRKIRDRIANELRWIVIVFSEEQIVKHPTECCKFISEFTESILIEEDIIGNFSSVTSLSQLKFSKERNINKLKKAKFRENYLAKYGLIKGFSEFEKYESAIENKISKKKTIQDNKKISIHVSKVSNNKISNESESEQLRLIKKVKEQLNKERKVTYKQEYIDKQKLIDDDNRKKEIAEKKFQAKLKKKKKESISKLAKSNDEKLKREAIILNDLDKALKNANDEYERLDEKAKKEVEQLIKEKENKFAEQKRIEQESIATKKVQKEKEEAERLENERKIAEQKRIEQERIATEKVQKEKEEAERLEKERKLVELEKKKHKEHLSKINIIDAKGKDIVENTDIEDKYKQQIELYVKSKKWDLVIKTANTAIAEIPNCYWAYYRIGTAQGNRGNFNEVIVNCSKSIEINPKFADAYFNRATANFFLENYKDAINDYQKSIDFDYSNLSEAYFNKGLCLKKIDLNKKAYREFLKAKDLGNKKAERLIKTQYMN